MKNTTPLSLSVSILGVSILSTTLIFKTLMTSWVCFVMILTFSSGMMTLFMYTASMTANEKTKTKKSYKVPILALALLAVTVNKTEKTSKDSMLTFSNKLLVMMIATALIFTMMSISVQGHHPNQTVSSSF